MIDERSAFSQDYLSFCEYQGVSEPASIEGINTLPAVQSDAERDACLIVGAVEDGSRARSFFDSA